MSQKVDNSSIISHLFENIENNFLFTFFPQFELFTIFEFVLHYSILHRQMSAKAFNFRPSYEFLNSNEVCYKFTISKQTLDLTVVSLTVL